MLQGASWHRCRTHFLRNLLTKVPKSAGPFAATIVRSIFAQPDQSTAVRPHARAACRAVPGRRGDAGRGGTGHLGVRFVRQPHWRQICSNNPQERLNKEIRCRTDIVGILPDRPSVIRLTGIVLAEQHDEWAVDRRYMSPDSLAKRLGPMDRRRGGRGGEERARRRADGPDDALELHELVGLGLQVLNRDRT